MKKDENRGIAIFAGFNMFASAFFVLECFLLLLNVFQLKLEAVDLVQDFIRTTSYFWTFLFVVIGIYYGFAKTEKKIKFINIAICVLNIILINNLYTNQRLDAVADFMQANSTYIFVILIALASLFGLYRFYRNNYNALRNRREIPEFQDFPELPPGRENDFDGMESRPADVRPPKEEEKAERDKVFSFSFFLIFLLILFGVLFCLTIFHPTVFAALFGSGNMVVNVVTVLAVLLLCLLVIVFFARKMYGVAVHLPDYLKEAGHDSGKGLRTILVIICTPVLYFVSRQMGVGQWLFGGWYSENRTASLFLEILLCFLICLSLFHIFFLIIRKEERPWMVRTKDILSKAGTQVIEILGRLIDSLFRLLQFIPDIINSLEVLLLGSKAEQEDRDRKGDEEQK